MDDDAIHLLRNFVRAYFNCSGYEPSVSVLGRAADEAKEFLNTLDESKAIDREYPWPEAP